MSTVARRRPASPNGLVRRSRSSTSARSRMKRRPDFGRPAGWKATRSRWRTSATGPTRHTRPTCGRWRFAVGLYARQGKPARAVRALVVRGSAASRGRQRASGAIAIELGQDLSLRMPELGVALPHDEIEAASAAVDALRALKPRFLVCHADMRESAALSEFESDPAGGRSRRREDRPRDRRSRRGRCEGVA